MTDVLLKLYVRRMPKNCTKKEGDLIYTPNINSMRKLIVSKSNYSMYSHEDNYADKLLNYHHYNFA